MYKLLLCSMMLLLTVSVIFESEIKRIPSQQQPVKKSITFTMYSDKNYFTSAYEDAMAQPRIIIHKIKADKKTVVWDKTYEFKYLRDYSSRQNPKFETVVINNSNTREKLEVTYVLRYFSKGSVLEVYNDTVFNPRMKSGEVEITL